MARVEHNTMDSMADLNLSYREDYAKKWLNALFRKLDAFFIQRGVILIFIGFLLGRALILSQLAPFAVPFFAAVYLLQKNKAPYALIGLIAGAATLHITNAAIIFAASIIFMLLYKIREPSIAQQYKLVPAYVLLSFGLTSFAMHYLIERKLLLYDGLMMGVEAGLAFILTLIFLQCIPLVFAPKRSRTLRTEEVVSLTILIASILTGTIGWTIYDLSFEHILSRYLVLIFALSAGAAIGSTVGVVTGLIFSLASVATLFQMSLLAFAGLLGGLLKEGRKIGTAAGLLVATVLIGLYGEGTANLTIALYESLVAIGLFMLTPVFLLEKISKFVPGTAEFSNEQQKYMSKVRDVTSQRVAQFSNVFKALSDSFTQVDEWNKEVDDDKEFDYFLSNITEKTCQTCHKKDRCWVQKFHTTYEGMRDLAVELSYNDRVVSVQTEREWKHCHKFSRVVDAISQELTFYQADQKLKKQVKESRKLVAEQLRGVSEVMDEFAKEIQKERKNHYAQEEQILEAITDFGLQLQSVEIYNLEKGNIDIDIALPYFRGGECEKLIAPMLSDILGETIVVSSEDIESQPGMCFANFRSTQKFVVTTGVAHAAKGGGLISGDSYSLMEIGAGKYAMAISDGMGNGERAKMESSETLELLQKILLSGIDEKVAIKSINSILSLRTTDEIFSTLDLALVDLHDAKAKFLKVCSTPSFIKRSDRVFKIESSNLPIGFMDGVDVEVVSEQLKAEDLLIMMSDGILEGPGNVENVEFWLKRKIKDLKTDKPQEVADLILEEVIRTRGDISDDMTVVVAKIKHNTPRWSAIPVSSFRKKAQ